MVSDGDAVDGENVALGAADDNDAASAAAAVSGVARNEPIAATDCWTVAADLEANDVDVAALGGAWPLDAVCADEVAVEFAVASAAAAQILDEKRALRVDGRHADDAASPAVVVENNAFHRVREPHPVCPSWTVVRAPAMARTSALPLVTFDGKRHHATARDGPTCHQPRSASLRHDEFGHDPLVHRALNMKVQEGLRG